MMRIIEEIRNKFRLLNRPLHRVLTVVGKFFLKHRIHVYIIFSMLIYLAIIPSLYASLFIKTGKPVDVIIDLPYASPFIHFGFDDPLVVTDHSQREYQIDGWAFLDNAPDQTHFEKYLVLKSRQRVYFYSYEVKDRQGVYEYYRDLGIENLYSGFRAIIAPEAIQPGTYNIGFLFKEKEGSEVYYSCSDRYFIRTPNFDSIEIDTISDGSIMATSPSSDASSQYGVGEKFIPLNFKSDKQIQAFVDSLSKETIAGREYERLSGWSFLENEDDQSKYIRWVILESDKNTIQFPLINVERSELPEVFPQLTSHFTGFIVDIFEGTLPLGVYEIAFVFQSRTDGLNYYLKTPWVITKTSAEFSMEKK